MIWYVQSYRLLLHNFEKRKTKRSQTARLYKIDGLFSAIFFYKERKLKDKLPAMSEEEQLQLLATNGMMVKRPLLIDGDTVLIGSVFAPMIAIQIADFFLLKRDKSSLAVHIPNLIIWVIGFVVYRILMNIDMPLGNTLPDMVITIVICLIVGKFVS